MSAPAPPAPLDPAGAPLLEVENLQTHFFTDDGILPAVRGVSFSIKKGQTLALVGESGCGKSVTAYSLLQLIQPPGRIVGGSIRLHSARAGTIDVSTLRADSPLLYRVRGGLVGMIFQEPMTALSPVHTVGDQIMETILLHSCTDRAAARLHAISMLRQVGIPNPERSIDSYPHEMSGGMRQRAVIAMALAGGPELLIADEPTTALDVTLQAQVLRLIKEMQQRIGCSVLLITHDLGVVAQVADEVAVMYLGRIVEHGPVRQVLKWPSHPYTRGLLGSLPGLNGHNRLHPIPGAVPPLHRIPRGCAFHPRCPHAKPTLCDIGGAPELRPVVAGQASACLRTEELNALS